MAVIIEGSQIF